MLVQVSREWMLHNVITSWGKKASVCICVFVIVFSSLSNLSMILTSAIGQPDNLFYSLSLCVYTSSPSCGPSLCQAVGPAGFSLHFHIIDNWLAQGMKEWNGRANAFLLLQLLLAATATGAENRSYRFVIINILVSNLPKPLCLPSFLFFLIK